MKKTILISLLFLPFVGMVSETDLEDLKKVVRICTRYVQSGMWNIFPVIFSLTLAFSFYDPDFFVFYLISIAVFGLFEVIYLVSAGGTWDNAKKLVGVKYQDKNLKLHEV